MIMHGYYGYPHLPSYLSIPTICMCVCGGVAYYATIAKKHWLALSEASNSTPETSKLKPGEAEPIGFGVSDSDIRLKDDEMKTCRRLKRRGSNETN